MKQYTPQDIQQLIRVTGGTPEEQAAALAVVEAAIIESRKLGRVALGSPKSAWHKDSGLLRTGLDAKWGRKLR
ncbi:MAG: hypothetical protein O3A98_02715 [Actinomycetota bacterium]|nr:hypothetical protein [Actinomycetota bacterium]